MYIIQCSLTFQRKKADGDNYVWLFGYVDGFLVWKLSQVGIGKTLPDPKMENSDQQKCRNKQRQKKSFTTISWACETPVNNLYFKRP